MPTRRRARRRSTASRPRAKGRGITERLVVGSARDGAAVLDVAVVPNAKRTEVVGLHDGALRVRLQAPPIDGRANAALIAWLADALGVARRDVTIQHGESSRRKRVHLQCEAARVQTWVDGLVGAAGDVGTSSSRDAD